ncbi:ExeM/NucH family extracellular endonuclease [Sulfitobacter sp. D35]|uniref:ExeM/NucH family extracellular endonuclease n=1 Tax=Sulfitobacter sp. D35 TaxID=3083252 RepID=UPI00296FA66B|nr:ExeM/NucH family extracellular endonuclease [Sulfitobacter sp. D35]MDW4496997.1 ExeM/NucH family extracellular endonuclease [Sulfitobacter sp. D35]
MARVIYSNDFNDFLGLGLVADPGAGQLDSDVFMLTGFSDGGSSGASGDFARGATSGAVTSGGLYALERDATDNALLIQPTGSDFTPGALTLTLDSGDVDLSSVTVSYDQLVRNDATRANSFSLWFSLDGVSFTEVFAYTSVEAADAGGLTVVPVSVALPDLPANTAFYLQWRGDDVSGSGSRDEFGIDNLVVAAEDAAGNGIVINEVLASTAGTDSEYVEIFGAAGASLAGLSLIAVESDDIASKGSIDFRYDFTAGDVIGANGFFLLANATAQTTYGVAADVLIGENAFENSSVTFAVVETASLSGGSVTVGETVLDAVALSDGGATDSFFFGAPVIGPDGTFFPAGAGRVADGVDTDSVADWTILDFGNDPAVNTPTAGTDPVEEVPTVINEVLASTTGTDSEYIEIFGTPGASLAGLSFIAVEGNDASGPGAIEFRYDFAGDAVIGDNGFLLLANQTAAATYGVTPNVIIAENSLENSSATYALVETASLAGDVVTGGESVIDAVASIDSTSSTSYFGAPVIGPDGSFFPAGVGRIADGVDTDQASDWKILNFFNDTAENTPVAGTGLGGGGGGGGDVSIDDDPTLISAVQGTEDVAALVGQTVVIEAIVTGDFQNGDDDPLRDLGGFFLMEESSDRDGDAMTSEGIFAYEGSGDLLSDVAAGDKVRVLGTVAERFGKTVIEVTEIRLEEASSVDPLSLAVTTSVPDVEDREALESMLVTVEESLTFSESFDYENFQQATLSTDGPVYQYTQVNNPDAVGNAAYQEEVADRTILIEDGQSGRRGDGDPLRAPDGELIDFADAAQMGQSVTGLTAIMDFDFGEFRLRIPEGVDLEFDPATNPVEAAPADVGSDYKVGSLNVLNYFTTLSGQTDIGASPRGAESAEELARQTEKLVTTILGMDADVIGLIEIENDFAGEEFAIQTLVAEINATLGQEIWSFVDPGQEFVGDDAIAVAFIYDTTSTRLIGDAAILDSEDFLDPLGEETSGTSFNRAALAQTFEDIDSGGQFTASVNHFKSKGSLTGAEADEDQRDGAGNNNATRTAAAQELAEWLATDPTGSGDEDVLILGDLNAYARETPIQVLEAEGYTDLARAFEGDEVYSYRFSGQIGTLDYALANAALEEQVTGATTWNVNSDTPVYFDYNLDGTFTGQDRPTDQNLFDGSSPLRGSDHDPVIIGLDLERDDFQLVEGRSKSEFLRGSDAAERFEGKGGPVDIVRGGGNEDVFVFGDRDGKRDKLIVLDFDTEEDRLDLDGAVIAEVSAIGRNLRISLDQDRDEIFLLRVSDFDAVQIDNEGLAFV